MHPYSSMKPLTKRQRERLLANGARRGADHAPVVKFFNPCGATTWLFNELDQDGVTLFGLADLGFGTSELGCSSLREISAVRVRFGLGIERDLHFRANGRPHPCRSRRYRLTAIRPRPVVLTCSSASQSARRPRDVVGLHLKTSGASFSKGACASFARLARLFREPFRIRLHVDHRHGAAKLKFRNQLEQEGSRGLAAIVNLVPATFSVEVEIPMGRDATHIEAIIALATSECIPEGISQGRRPSHSRRSTVPRKWE